MHYYGQSGFYKTDVDEQNDHLPKLVVAGALIVAGALNAYVVTSRTEVACC